MSFSHELRVRYGECDPQGIVFNANYLAYFDIAVTELWREAIGPWQTMVDRGVDVVVAEANLSFRRPARFGDVLVLEARVGPVGGESMSVGIAIRRGDERLVEGWLRQVWVDAETWEKTPIPDWARE